ncbi:MAG: endolytic transglycosylase MltG [Cyclobacteriaceae bacterium]
MAWWLRLNQWKAGIYGIIFLVACLLFIALFTPNTSFVHSQYDLYIDKDQGIEQLWQQEPETEVLHNRWGFRLASLLLDFPDSANYGLFTLENGWNNWQVIDHLKGHPRPSVPIAIYPYQLRKNMLRKLCQNLDIKPTALAELLTQSELNTTLGFDQESVYCLFIPDTIMVYKDIRTLELVDRLYRHYQDFWNEQRRYRADRMDLAPEEVSILASIVYAETKNPEEMPRIAGLYLNRLDQEMKLQADPTLVHAYGRSLRRVLKKHKRIRSPYNTYRNYGLPPGPIFTAPKEALEAVLNYEEHSYLYFCARSDFSGNHDFSRTLESHLAKARAYQKALNKKRIY